MTVLKHSYSKVTGFEIIAFEDLILSITNFNIQQLTIYKWALQCFLNAFSQVMATDFGWYIKRYVWTEKYPMNQKNTDKIFLGRDVQWETFWNELINDKMLYEYQKSTRSVKRNLWSPTLNEWIVKTSVIVRAFWWYEKMQKNYHQKRTWTFKYVTFKHEPLNFYIN